MRPRGTAATVAQLGEFGFLSRLIPRVPLRRGTLIGPGHDCAVIRGGRGNWLFTVDALVEGVHFRRTWLSPRQLGRKSFLVNASDIAAMGGTPRFCVVNFAVPGAYRADDLLQVQRGIVDAAAACDAAVVGGNLTRAAQLSIAVALLGEAPRRLVSRAGARPGDAVCVTGTLGDAAAGVRALRSSGHTRAAAALIRRYRAPSPRLRAGRVLVERGIVSAMIDVSDGLVQDLGHICSASGVGAHIDAARVPRSAAYRALLGGDSRLALSGGEDYELLCTVPARRMSTLDHHAAALGCRITRIGHIVHGRGVQVDGALPAAGGYDHFRTR